MRRSWQNVSSTICLWQVGPDKTSKPVLTKRLPDKTSKAVLTKCLPDNRSMVGRSWQNDHPGKTSADLVQLSHLLVGSIGSSANAKLISLHLTQAWKNALGKVLPLDFYWNKVQPCPLLSCTSYLTVWCLIFVIKAVEDLFNTYSWCFVNGFGVEESAVLDKHVRKLCFTKFFCLELNCNSLNQFSIAWRSSLDALASLKTMLDIQ